MFGKQSRVNGMFLPWNSQTMCVHMWVCVHAPYPWLSLSLSVIIIKVYCCSHVPDEECNISISDCASSSSLTSHNHNTVQTHPPHHGSLQRAHTFSASTFGFCISKLSVCFHYPWHNLHKHLCVCYSHETSDIPLRLFIFVLILYHFLLFPLFKVKQKPLDNVKTAYLF